MAYAHELKALIDRDVVKVDERGWGQGRAGFVLEDGQVVVVELSTTEIVPAEDAKKRISERLSVLQAAVSEASDAQDTLDKVKAIVPEIKPKGVLL